MENSNSNSNPWEVNKSSFSLSAPLSALDELKETQRQADAHEAACLFQPTSDVPLPTIYPPEVRAAAVGQLGRPKHPAVQAHLLNIVMGQPLLDTSVPDSGSKVWPRPLNRDAYIGLTGDFIRAVEPNSEADPNALVVIWLTAIGCWFGRAPHHLSWRYAPRHKPFLGDRGCNFVRPEGNRNRLSA